MLPCLTLFGDIIGIVCGYFYNVVLMGVNGTIYLRNTLQYLELWDVAERPASRPRSSASSSPSSAAGRA